MGILNKIDENLPKPHGSEYAEFKAIEGNHVISPSGVRNFFDNPQKKVPDTFFDTFFYR